MKDERKKYAAILSAVEENAATSHWYPDTRKQLEKRGFEVYALVMPEPNYPDREERIAAVHDFLRRSKEGDTYLIGHSVGGASILRALESLHEAFQKFRSTHIGVLNHQVGDLMGKKFAGTGAGHDSWPFLLGRQRRGKIPPWVTPEEAAALMPVADEKPLSR